MVANQIDLAIEELSRAASLDADALEVHMILGNLYREKGQVGKAITVHQGLLQRPRLRGLEHAYVLLCLGLDYKRGGFVERALEAFNEVLRLDPKNEYALVNLQKLHEEQHQWTEAYDTRQRLSKLTDIDARPKNQAILAFLENEIGLEAIRRKDYTEAIRRFEGAIDLDPRAVPAYLNLGDVRVVQGNEKEAAAIWEKLINVAPDRAYLAFDRLEALAVRTGSPERFTRLCRRLIDESPQDWRARLALSRHLAASGHPHDALDLLFAALMQNPHALGVHQAIWRALGQLHHPASSIAIASSPGTPCSTSIRMSACAAATAARSCCGNARTVTTGIRSLRNGLPRPRTRRKWRLENFRMRGFPRFFPPVDWFPRRFRPFESRNPHAPLFLRQASARQDAAAPPVG